MKESKSFTTTILWAFIILNISSLMIFTFSVRFEDEERALKSSQTGLSELVNEKAELISISLKNIEAKTENMSVWMEYFLKQDTSEQLSKSYYINEVNGVLLRRTPIDMSYNNYSAVFLPNNIDITKDVIREINITENMDPIFNKTLEQEEMLKWVYVATTNEFLRVLPFYTVDAFDNEHWQTEDTFYKIANEQNNPERKSVWTSPYVDYLGTGWTMTCSHPVYDSKDNFFGVLCSDVNIEELRKKFLEGFKLGESGKIYLLTNSGGIIYHPDYEKKAEKQGELYDKNIFELESAKGTKLEVIEKALEKESSLFKFTEGNKSKMIAGCRIEGQPWTAIIEIDEKEFLAQNRIDGKVIMQLFFIGIILALVLVVILYYEFSVPMRTLVEGVRTISKGGFGRVRTNTSFFEINELSEAFNYMNDNLQEYTEKLIYKNNEITTLLDTIDGFLMIIDANYNVKVKNKKTEKREIEEKVCMKKCYAILAKRREPCENCILKKVLEEKNQEEKELIVDGEIYKNIYYPIIGTTGEVKEIVILSQCITKSIAMKNKMQQIEKMAEVGQFSAAIAHEIKNPLAVIKGATYIMNTYNKKKSQAGEYTEEIELIENAVKEAEHVIETLLDFSAQGTEKGGFVDLKKLTEQILMISKKEIIKKSINVLVGIEVKPFFYNGNIDQIKIVLQNLINNSIQAVADGGEIAIFMGITDTNDLFIKVIDNGPGIKIKPRNKIFEPFITTKKDSGGTGIGLWITKTLIVGMGGSINVNENKKDGTEIEIILSILK